MRSEVQMNTVDEMEREKPAQTSPLRIFMLARRIFCNNKVLNKNVQVIDC
jgi:hypothetical protein